jgi:hypothetical protein
MFGEFAKLGASVARKQQLIEGDYAYIVWTWETADNSYELASDTFVIQNGSIRLQASAAKVKPKDRQWHRPIVSFARLCCDALIASDSIRMCDKKVWKRKRS